jgi:hypothetical protein
MRDGVMHRNPSISVSTIVAIMAAHRAASSREAATATFRQEEITRIDACLREEEPAKSAGEEWVPRRLLRTRRKSCF